jgi:hypothetical protein
MTIEQSTDRADHGHHPAMNHLVLALLHSPVHEMIDSGLCELRYAAPRAGHEVVLPVMYTPIDGNLVVLVGHAVDKTWWRTFRKPWPVDVYRRDGRMTGIGHVITEADSRYWRALHAYRQQHHVSPKAGDRVVLIEPLETYGRTETDQD